MRASLIAGTLAFVASAVAQYNVTSDPFSLVLRSISNSTLNGTPLYACHEGAAIEGLCLGGNTSPSSQQFHFNTSEVIQSPSGYLTFTLVGGNFIVSQPMMLSYNDISNVAIPLFQPSESGTLVAFDAENKLYIEGYLDDTKVPMSPHAPMDYYRWWACTTYAGYQYETLAWVMGNGVPQNPTCQKVDVVRVF
jgi:hypothetical protein